MKCERCNAKIKTGDLFCKECGAQIEINSDNANNADHNKKKEDSDIFYQKGMEGTTNPINVFLVIIVLLLVGGIFYLVYFNKIDINCLIKNNQEEEKASNEEGYKSIYYDNYVFEVLNTKKIKYNQNCLVIEDENERVCFYSIDDAYDTMVNNIDAIILKWQEKGITITSHSQLEINLYELEGTFQDTYIAFYVKQINGISVVIEANYVDHDALNNAKEELIKMVKSIRLSSDLGTNSFIYPEFNLDTIGSQ